MSQPAPAAASKRIPQLWEVAEQPDGTYKLVARMHEFQAKAWNSRARFTFMLAGTQGGKTSMGPLWLYREMKMCGPGDYIGVTSSFPLLEKKMLPEFLRFFKHTLNLGEWSQGAKMFTFSEQKARELWPGEDTSIPTRVIFGSAQNANSLESATAKGAWVDEVGQDDFTFAAWEAIIRRLSLAQGRAFGGTTLYNLGWFKQQVYERWLAGDTEYNVVQFPSIANPAFPREEFERRRATMDPWKFKMFYEGLYDTPPGMIYSMFLDKIYPAGHIVAGYRVPAEWKRYVGIDPGGVHHAKTYIAFNPVMDRFEQYHESISGRRTTADHAREVLDHIADAHTTLALVACGQKAEEQVRLDYAAAGLGVTEPEITDVDAGIDRIVALLMTKRFVIHDSCKETRDQFCTYSRELDDLGLATEKIKNKERYHYLDADRYILQWCQAGQPDTLRRSADRPSVLVAGTVSRPTVAQMHRNFLNRGD